MGPADLPNVLIVLLDDVGVDQVSPYGFHGAPPTPTIQSLAEQGLRFDSAWATPVCSPTRAALMTGQLPYHNHVGAVLHTHTRHELPLQAIILPEMLDESGIDWSSAAIGKWHLATTDSESGLRHPWLQGFDLFAGTVNNLGVEASIAPLTERTYINWERVDFDGTLSLSSQFATTQTTDDAITALGQLRAPWLLYVAYQAAHRPLMPPPNMTIADPLDEGELYSANVTAADAEIGRLLDALGEQRDRTLIFVLGDNGTPQHAKEEGDQEGGKGSFTEGGLRIPFIVAGPGVPAGEHSTALVHVVDIFPTLMELASVRSLPGVELDGVSLLPVFADPSVSVRSRLYTEQRHPPSPPWRRVSSAIRDESLKVVNIEGALSYWRIDGFTEQPVRMSSVSSAERKRLSKLERELSRYR